MANRFLSVETIEVVKAYIRDNIDKKPADIAEVFGFNTTTAYRYKVQVLAESRYRAPIKAVYLGARDISYFTEDEILHPRSPWYGYDERIKQIYF